MKHSSFTFQQFCDEYGPCTPARLTANSHQQVQPDTPMDQVWDIPWRDKYGSSRPDWRMWTITVLEGDSRRVDREIRRWTRSSKKARALRKAWDEARECSVDGSSRRFKAANAAWAEALEDYLRRYHKPSFGRRVP